MTATYSILVKLPSTGPVFTAPVTPVQVTAIVPAYNDQDGLTQTLLSLDSLGLGRIVVVDDGSRIPLEIAMTLSTPVMLIRHNTNKGAAAARNSGIGATTTDWVYFTDCGCVHSSRLLDVFAEVRQDYGPHISAIVGPVEALGGGFPFTTHTKAF